MNNTPWREQFAKDYTTKVFEGDSLEENTRNSLAYFTDFIETQIAQARREGFDDGWIACKVAYENGIKSALSISSL